MWRSVSRLGVLVVALAVVPSLLLASPIVITFDTLSDSDAITNQFPGLTFSDAVILTSGVSLNEFEFPPFSGENVASDAGGPMTIDFAQPISDFGGYFTYSVPLVLKAFDSTNVFLGSASSLFSSNELLSGDVGSSPNELLQLALSSISRVTITGGEFGGSFTLDNLTYTQSEAVPEPGTFGLVLLGGLSWLRWRRARKRFT